MKNFMEPKMKSIVLFIAVIILLPIFGCEENFFHPDMSPPSEPHGMYADAGDKFIDVFWSANTENDIAGYNIFVSTSINGRFQLIGSTRTTHFVDADIQNGITYYYRVSSYDFDQNESSLSADYAYATARPEGYDIVLKDYHVFPAASGYDFSTYSVGQYDDQYTDVFFDFNNGTYYMDVWEDSEIQDYGYTKSLYDIVEAPTSGWSPSKDVRLIVGHTYIVRTWDFHYAKIRIKDLSSTRVIFDWAYQLQSNNTQLKINIPSDRKTPNSNSGLHNR
jgi:hypothetical protein